MIVDRFYFPSCASVWQHNITFDVSMTRDLLFLEYDRNCQLYAAVCDDCGTYGNSSYECGCIELHTVYTHPGFTQIAVVSSLVPSSLKSTCVCALLVSLNDGGTNAGVDNTLCRQRDY